MKSHLKVAFVRALTSLASAVDVENALNGPCLSAYCQNNSTCAEGSADFSDHPTNGRGDRFSFLDFNQDMAIVSNQHCDCPEGFTGFLCEHEYVDCNDGRHKCYHGGECHASIHSVDPDDMFVCNCSATADPITDATFVGKFCEHEVNAGKCATGQFCVNGGQCGPVGLGGEPTCICPEGVVGPHCEFFEETVPTCMLDCQNGGSCAIGLRDTTEAEQIVGLNQTVNDNFQHCTCPSGYSGIFCEREHSSCGEGLCFHGSECVELINMVGEELYHCNCTTASTATASFAGMSCEHQSTGFCSKATALTGVGFCVNEGECTVDQTTGIQECACPPGFSGPRCEYPESLPGLAEFEKCDLKCHNGGKCLKGAKDYGVLNSIGPEIGHLINMTHAVNKFEYCDCPPGFVGVFCEHMAESCGAGEHVCFHGSKCVRESEDPDTCNCSASAEFTVGKFCQHTASDPSAIMCKKEELHHSFCLNGGTCLDPENQLEGHAGCKCKSGYSGIRCEFRSELSASEDSLVNTQKSYKRVIVLAMIAGGLSASIIGGLFFLATIMVIRRSEAKAFTTTDPSVTDDGTNGDWVGSLTESETPAEAAKAELI